VKQIKRGFGRAGTVLLALALLIGSTDCAPLKPYQSPPPTVGAAERQQIYEAQSVQQHWYGLAVGQHPLLNKDYWVTLQDYFQRSGDPAAAQQLAGWRHLSRWCQVLNYAGVALLAGGIIAGASHQNDEDWQRIAGPTAVSGLAALMACYGLQVIGDSFWTKPAIEHFNQFLRNDLQFTVGARAQGFAAAGTLGY
jgi:hypothetical protein